MNISAVLRWRFGSVLLLAVLIAVIPLVLPSSYFLRVAALVWVGGIAAMGLHILMGQAGQVSLGHTGFVGIGAYAVALLPARYGVPPLAAAAVGVVLSAAIAYGVGRPILRLQGHYLAVATLGFGLLVLLVITSEVAITGGPDGTNVTRLRVFSQRVTSPGTWYWISGAGVLIGMAVAVQLRHSPTGRALRGLQDSEVAAGAIGIDVAAKKLQAFVVAAVYAAVAGAMLALMNGFITPDVASFVASIEYVAMVVIGGITSPLGAVVGAAFLTLLPQLLASFHDYEDLLVGLLIMLFMIFLRRGIVPTLESLLAGRGR